MKRVNIILALAVWGAVVCNGSAVASGGGLREWAKELESLRSRIDDVDGRLRAEQSSGSAEIGTLVRRLGELRAQADRESVRYRAASDSVKELEQRLAERENRGDVFVPVVESGLADLRAGIVNGLPYRVKDRLAALDEVALEMSSGRIGPEEAASKLWRLFEDELRLTQEVILTKIPVTLEKGKGRRMVRVVRLGMTALYTELGNGRYGRFVRGSEGRWKHERLDRGEAAEGVEKLFSALENNMLEGGYKLPLPPVTGFDGEREGGGK